MRKTILVTGAAGFIGTAMVRHLRSQKMGKILSVDLKKNVIKDPLFFRLDLLDQAAVKRFLQRHKPQVIFHLAGGRLADSEAMFTANVMTTYGLLNAVISVRGYHPRVVVVGSAAEYGVCSHRKAVTEDVQGKIDGIYARCKALQTKVALHFVSRGADVIVARLFNILGPGIPVASAGGKFATEIVAMERDTGIKELRTGNLSAVRDFLDIRDICSALGLLIGQGRSGEIYNVCSQRGLAIKDMVLKMTRISTRKKILVRMDIHEDAGIPYSVGANVKLKKDTGWRPRYTFQQSVVDTLNYCRATRGAC